MSRPLDAGGRFQLGFGFAPAALISLVDDSVAASLALESADEAAARVWCDARLADAGLETTARAEMPYELPAVSYTGFAGSAAALETLGAWYACAQNVLEGLVAEFGAMAVSEPAIRCWPHHFDLATLFMLDEGDPETARSIGVGLSPGDDSSAEPYFYCTPWPTPEDLPAPPVPLGWHTEGFTSLVCAASRIDAGTDLDEVLASAVRLARETLR